MTFLERPITAVINHLLSRQALVRDKLRGHAGKVACIETGIVQLNLAVRPDGFLQSDVSDQPTVTIHIESADVPKVIAD